MYEVIYYFHKTDPDNKKESPFDWWSKYYASGNDDTKIQPEYIDEGYDLLKVGM